MPATPNKDSSQVAIKAGRGPAYPFIPLREAVARVEQLDKAGATRTAIVPESCYQIWGIGSKSSNAKQTLAALNHFGLVEYIGRGDSRKVQLSDLARKIVLDKVPNSSNRVQSITSAALMPSIHTKLWEKFGAFIPDRVIMESFLTLEEEYSKEAAQSIIDEYLDTIEYAGLNKPGQLSTLAGDNQANLEAPVTNESQPESVVSRSETARDLGQDPPLKPNCVKAVWPLDEGEAVLILPDILSRESFAELEVWLQAILKKAARKAGIDAQSKKPPATKSESFEPGDTDDLDI